MALSIITIAPRVDIEMPAGALFQEDIELRDKNNQQIDLTGFTFDGEVRINVSGAIIANFIGLVTASGAGAVRVTMLPAETRNEKVGSYDYDWRLRLGTTEYIPRYGIFRLLPGVTQP